MNTLKLLLVLAVLAAIVLMWQALGREERACQARGGILIKGYEPGHPTWTGYVCVTGVETR
jgi:hypothetical protein